MAKIVCVHGVGHQFRGSNILLAHWLPAIKDGLDRAGHVLRNDGDVACSYYGDLFRPTGKGASIPPYDADDVTEEFEKEMLLSWWRESARVDPAVPAVDSNSKIATPHLVQRALDALSHSKFFSGIAERALIFDLKQLRRYLQEPTVRATACDRIAGSVGEDTRVIIAHSLGSVVAYETLGAHPEWAIHTFITLGSPLGLKNIVFDKLQPSPKNRLGVWPGSVLHWVNIADKGDIVALVKQLSTCFGPRVSDKLVHNGSSAHDATHYLTTRELGDAVARAL